MLDHRSLMEYTEILGCEITCNYGDTCVIDKNLDGTQSSWPSLSGTYIVPNATGEHQSIVA